MSLSRMMAKGQSSPQSTFNGKAGKAGRLSSQWSYGQPVGRQKIILADLVVESWFENCLTTVWVPVPIECLDAGSEIMPFDNSQ